MGLFSFISTITDIFPKAPTPESLREKHGFSNFDQEMERLKNFDLDAALEKQESVDAEKNKSGQISNKTRK